MDFVAVAKIVAAAITVVPLVLAWIGGYRWLKTRQQAKALKAREKQINIAARPNLHRNDILDRMRSGKL
jgi:hypothetical protein